MSEPSTTTKAEPYMTEIVNTVYNPSAEELARVKPDETIIATGPWRKGPHDLPHRVVLRRLGGENEFVVHTQAINDIGASFGQGDYFSIMDPGSFNLAWKAFEARVRRHHNLKTR